MNDLTVVGLGYVGLPTAALFARAGLRVAGADLNPRIVEAVNAGRSPIEEPGLDQLVREMVGAGRLSAAPSPQPADAFVIAVGTPVGADHRPDLDAVASAADAVGRVLRPGNVVILESTVPPGTTATLARERLERASGLVAGADFHLAHCAERAIPGSALREMVDNDRLVGGIDAASTKTAAALYARMVKGAIVEGDALTSEIVKLAENTYRDVNIAFANELAALCEAKGADVWKVLEHANRHPRVHIHRPGPGVGGHCIPVVPWFLVAASPNATPLIRLAREVNDAQPRRVVERVLALVRGRAPPIGPRVAVLGVAYKSGIDDARETPALPILDALAAAGAEVRASDPHVQRFRHPLLPLEEALRGADAILVLNDEPAYAALDPAFVAKLARGRVVVDTRRVLDAHRWRAAGFEVHVLGQGVA